MVLRFSWVGPGVAIALWLLVSGTENNPCQKSSQFSQSETVWAYLKLEKSGGIPSFPIKGRISGIQMIVLWQTRGCETHPKKRGGIGGGIRRERGGGAGRQAGSVGHKAAFTVLLGAPIAGVRLGQKLAGTRREKGKVRASICVLMCCLARCLKPC